MGEMLRDIKKMCHKMLLVVVRQCAIGHTLFVSGTTRSTRDKHMRTWRSKSQRERPVREATDRFRTEAKRKG